ncbi:GNAT family N-acetyltransferase [Streptomyces sp. NPDC051219]|uniref:GNAT family N-acetyltransferase n=1 Tax=Streptomyces sp. NPDC051219 TaxID=3155283 RepID=UPI00343DDAA9
MEIRRATTAAELKTARHLFDGPVQDAWAERFLASPGHLMLIAYVGGFPAGMLSGIEMSRPDKGPEMCLYELGVDEAYRRRGIGHALTQAVRPAQLAIRGIRSGSRRGVRPVARPRLLTTRHGREYMRARAT